MAGEAIGSAGLLIAVVGSGIMGERLAGGNVALALLANSVATGAALFVLILLLAPISGAHLNPVVSLVERLRGHGSTGDMFVYMGAQLVGALAGVAMAHAMFELPVWSLSARDRGGWAQALAEAVATCGLVLTILGTRRYTAATVAAAVACFIAGAYWFTASTSFANPAVTLARASTATFAGIAPIDVPAFVAAQFLGGAGGLALWRWLDGDRGSVAS